MDYGNYYGDPRLSAWRDLSAKAKAANVVLLTSELGNISTVLEVGGGDGAVLGALDSLGFAETYEAVEISDSGLTEMNARHISRLRHAQLFDGEHLPHSDSAFDLAVLSHVVEHVDSPRKLLREAARVARYVFVEVPCEDTVRLPNDYAANTIGHVNFYSPRSIRYEAQASGLKILRQVVRPSSREAHATRRGMLGGAIWAAKRLGAAVTPRIATRIFVYNSALICESVRRR